VPDSPIVVAVINSNEDTVNMLRTVLEEDGFLTVPGHVNDIQTGREDFLAFLATHDPRALVYDIAPPYEENWTFLKLLLDTEAMRGRQLVVTTTNKAALERFVGPTDAIEIFGKPYDLDLVRQTVRSSVF
jgi:hypothetical protein